MSRRRARPDAGTGGTDPGGPLIMVCRGRHCSAARAQAGTQDRLGELQRAVRNTRGAVLVGADCLGACGLAAVAAVARRDGITGHAGPAVWLAGVHEEDRADAVADWIRAGGPEPDVDPDVGLPVALVEAVAGLGRPPRLARPGA